MIAPRDNWAIKIAVYSQVACPMDRLTFERAVKAVAGFADHDDGPLVRSDHPRRVIGFSAFSGADPLDHPLFGQLVNIMAVAIPDREHRGLWTGLAWANHRHKDQVEYLLGPRPGRETTDRIGLLAPQDAQPKWNQANDRDRAVLTVQEAVPEESRMWKVIERCPHQRRCGAAVTPQGFFFCEAAACLASRGNGSLGMPVDPGCWAHDLADYRHQIEEWCPRCELCLVQEGVAP